MATKTESPISLNTQDFSGSDDEIMDNFADGPNPNDDGTPMGVGGEKGKQSEPASSTLESDIVNGTITKQPDETTPSEKPAGERETAQEPAGETGPEITEPESEEPETPEFPAVLLQMAGLPDADAARAAGFQNPEALFAAVKWRGQLLAPGAQPAQPPEKGLYRRPTQQPTVPAAPQAPVAPAPAGEVRQFQLPSEKMEMLDEDLQDVIRQMNDHYQREVESLRASVSQRESDLETQKAIEEEVMFDKAVENLGKDWQDVFGSGSGFELAQASQRDPVAMTNYNHRALLFETVQAVRDVNARQGYKPMTIEQEVHWALMQRYPDKFQQIVSGSSNSRSGTRPGVTASRPTQRKTPPKTQNDRTLSAVDAMLRKKHGYALPRTPREEEFDGEI